MPSSARVGKKFEEHVLSHLRLDSLYFVIRNDEYILKLGKRLYDDVGTGEESGNYVRQKMKELARILVQYCKLSLNDSATLLSCLKPEKMKLFIEAIKQVAGFNDESMLFETPTLVKKVQVPLSGRSLSLQKESQLEKGKRS